MESHRAYAILADVDANDLYLGVDSDNWADYLRARRALGMPVDLKPIDVASELPNFHALLSFERELLLPVIQPVVTDWLKSQGLLIGDADNVD